MGEKPESILLDTNHRLILPPAIDLLEVELNPFVNLEDGIFVIERDSLVPPPFPLAITSGPVRR